MIASIVYKCDICGNVTREGDMHDVKVCLGGWRCGVGGTDRTTVYSGEVCGLCRDKLEDIVKHRLSHEVIEGGVK